LPKHGLGAELANGLHRRPDALKINQHPTEVGHAPVIALSSSTKKQPTTHNSTKTPESPRLEVQPLFPHGPVPQDSPEPPNGPLPALGDVGPLVVPHAACGVLGLVLKPSRKAPERLDDLPPCPWTPFGGSLEPVIHDELLEVRLQQKKTAVHVRYAPALPLNKPLPPHESRAPHPTEKPITYNRPIRRYQWEIAHRERGGVAVSVQGGPIDGVEPATKTPRRLDRPAPDGAPLGRLDSQRTVAKMGRREAIRHDRQT
jgi:hypothetical protein